MVDRPALQAPVLVFDGGCPFCRHFAELAELRSGIPGLSRIPVVGALFGQKTRTSRRSEVIVLLTPTIVRNSQESRNLTDEYSKRFRAMEPLNQPRAKK